MAKSKFNKEHRENAAKVLAYLSAYPDRHNQSSWFEVDVPSAYNAPLKETAFMVEDNLCKTNMCVAGTVMWQNYGAFGLSLFVDGEHEDLATNEAARLLGLEEDEAHTVFFSLSNEDALTVIERIAAGKKNIWKGTDYAKYY